VKALYVNHTAEIGGGERWLVGLLRALPENGAQAIIRVAEDLELAVQMGREGRACVQSEFSVERHVRAMLEPYGPVAA
jgi:hypothetical protein